MTDRIRLPRKRPLAMLLRVLNALRREPQPQTFPALTKSNLPPMRGKTRVLRDERGIPHIYADEEPDLYAALGFLQGADRFVTIDALRHIASGRLSELIGDLRAPRGDSLIEGRRIRDVDAFVRPLGFEARSRNDAARLSSRPAACLAAFAEGINAALRAMRGCYPPEYLALGRVRAWEPADSLLSGQACAFIVSLTNLDNELVFDAVRGKVGDPLARRIYPEAPWESAPTSYQVEGELPTPEPPIHGTGGGSNNWAVSGARSASAAPIVGNDPHVPLIPLPTFWYHAHLECPRYRVQGGVFPGCPVFGFGHNGHLAWGVTTGYRDGWDLYRIHRLPGRRDRYRTPDGEGQISTHRETLESRFRRRTELTWESCEHGVLYPGWTHHDGRELAVRYVSADLATYFEGGLDLVEAATVEAHRAAVAKLNEGPFDFNHVYAHREGHIAWELYGHLPRRPIDGLFVRDAHDSNGRWDGYLSFEEMPKIVNPPSGRVASANTITDPENFARIASRTHFEPRYRQDRIEAQLGAEHRHTYETFAALQGDLYAAHAEGARTAILAALAPVAEDNTPAGDAYRALRSWKGDYAVDQVGATVLHAAVHQIARLAYGALFGSALGARFTNGRRALPRLYALLGDPNDPLRDDIERAANRTIDDLVRDGFGRAVAALAARRGPDASRWQWGMIQRARLGTALAYVPRIGRHFTAYEGPFPGDEYTVSPSRSIPVGEELIAFVGASSRFICDLSRPEEALFAHNSGPSGDVASVFYANLAAPWQRFEYFRSALWAPDDVPNVVEGVVVGAE